MKVELSVDINDLVLQEKLTAFEKQLVRCAASSEQLAAYLHDLHTVYNDLPEPVRRYLKIQLPNLP